MGIARGVSAASTKLRPQSVSLLVKLASLACLVTSPSVLPAVFGLMRPPSGAANRRRARSRRGHCPRRGRAARHRPGVPSLREMRRGLLAGRRTRGRECARRGYTSRIGWPICRAFPEHRSVVGTDRWSHTSLLTGGRRNRRQARRRLLHSESRDQGTTPQPRDRRVPMHSGVPCGEELNDVQIPRVQLR